MAPYIDPEYPDSQVIRMLTKAQISGLFNKPPQISKGNRPNYDGNIGEVETRISIGTDHRIYIRAKTPDDLKKVCKTVLDKLIGAGSNDGPKSPLDSRM